jgi:hypothetical protein
MSQCSHELIEAGEPHPRTCVLCGLGPCAKERTPPPVRYADASDLAEAIASAIYPYSQDRDRHEKVAYLLTLFAAEIRRSAIEP